MKKIVIETFGKIKDKSTQELCKKYLDLCNHYIRTEVNVHKDVDGRKINTTDISLKADFIILSERGKQLTSEGFSKMLSKLEENQQEIHFVIGNAYGVEEEIINKGRNLSLSPMTFTHEMTILLLLEQIYRANNIRAGGKYHK